MGLREREVGEGKGYERKRKGGKGREGAASWLLGLWTPLIN